MLAFLRAKGVLTERKARLFAVACFRSIWPLVTEPSTWRNGTLRLGERPRQGRLHRRRTARAPSWGARASLESVLGD
jgi:hypothetical protein